MVKWEKLNNVGIKTKLSHLGNHPERYHGFVNPPVVRASTVLFPDHETMKNRDQQYTYGTRGTPTTDALAEALTHLEGAEGTILVPSGLAAISVPMLAFAKSGSHCLIVDSIYGPTREFSDNMLARLGVEVEYFDPAIGSGFNALLRENTSIVMLESPGSNTFEMLDVAAITSASHEVDAVVMIDNTWASPLFFKPLEHGVDISIHALTKYPNGHADLVMGSVSANKRCWKELRAAQMQMGVCAQGDDCYSVLRGMRTMAIRLEHHEKSALSIASWLSVHKHVARVLHPALPGDPGYDLWKRDFTGSTGLFSFVLKDASDAQVGDFLNSLCIFGLGYSWAGYESLALAVDTSDRLIAKAPEDGRLIRLQIGLEDTRDLVEDLDRGLKNSMGT